ncbi:family 4 glycosyl hydrolase [Cellvibrio japonicus]|uniref:6-phospho-beta-glucosidase, putative, pbg4A n=1 Tax=Cellvibrio japonicus (strain Ueda107) TaxID=498211 RepID=B3PEF0_CELJU|nr:6-phospho-beta-glucosidase [Cellvibrio japonicus]ACE83112.1 6-phospho-beta-glucosidase, putative, pbg4A [Cellvibrio japonicus Ueda107]QEI13524.1 6-phospho-beta-glucosidase [Cellvibrio japonicus]QEI17098.1 6-phospho-beta-glucosidase [Cellvibrio japonicus]QEI20675.1 6-phospho-beta-glucosidase [Cellvibrio japonicus]
MAKPGLFILGGSTYYTLLLFQAMKDVALDQHLGRITLFARNESRLRTLVSCGTELFAGSLRVDYSLQLEDCLSSEYALIFNQMRFGGLKSRDQDEKIALDVGLFADETLGIVGASNAVRTITALKPFLELIQQKQGSYQFINFTNPCSIVTEYIKRHFAIPVVGICDYPQMMRHSIAHYYGVAVADVDARYFGINHFGYLYDVKVKGEDKLAELCRTPLPFKPDVNRYFNNLLNISWHYLFEQDTAVQQQRQKANRASQLLDIEAELDQCVERHGPNLDKVMAILHRRECHWFELVVAPLLRALVTGLPHQEYLNLVCESPLSLGEPTVIEANASIHSGCLVVDDLPIRLVKDPEFMWVQQMKLAETRMLRAILARDFDGVVTACLINPLIANKNKIIKYFACLNQVDEAFNTIFN